LEIDHGRQSSEFLPKGPHLVGTPQCLNFPKGSEFISICRWPREGVPILCHYRPYTAAHGTGGLVGVTVDLPLDVGVGHSVPAFSMEHVATVQPPKLLTMSEVFQAYGALPEITIEDGRPLR